VAAIAQYITGFLLLVCALGVVLSRRVINSGLCLLAALFLVAVEFSLLHAQFLAVVQLLLYAGAVMVLFVFVILLFGVDRESYKLRCDFPLLFAAVVAGAFAGIVLFVIKRSELGALAAWAGDSALGAEFGSVQSVGRALFTQYLYPFELIGVLVLAALIASVALAKEPSRPLAPGRGLKAMREKHLAGSSEQSSSTPTEARLE